MTQNDRPRVPIDAERLWQRHMAMAQHGATQAGGVNRGALTAPDVEVHRLLAEYARERGFEVLLDDYGNQFMRRAGSDENALPLVSGSHSDSQPTGGRFDGIFGVLAAFEALEAIDDAGSDTRHPLEAVIWNNEEGVRFTPTDFGSAVYTGATDLNEMLSAVDGEGVTLSAAVAQLRDALPWAGRRELGDPIAAFVEAHIEQGPELEARSLPVGIVTGIQGTRKFEIEVIGEEAHAGTTPRRMRRDAFVDATLIVAALHRRFHDADDRIRFTIGKFHIVPGALAVVPGRVVFTIDFRHPEESVLAEYGDDVETICRRAASVCDVVVRETRRVSPSVFSGAVPEAIEQALIGRGTPYMRLPSGAGHDARYLADFCPTGMLFIPCEKGISHNEREYASPEDVAAGAQALADTLLILDAAITA